MTPSPSRTDCAHSRESTQGLGIDVDSASAQGTSLVWFALIQSPVKQTVASSSGNGVIADFALKHIPDPDLFLWEISRVLKSGAFIAT